MNGRKGVAADQYAGFVEAVTTKTQFVFLFVFSFGLSSSLKLIT
jgi:hypothetical protein